MHILTSLNATMCASSKGKIRVQESRGIRSLNDRKIRKPISVGKIMVKLEEIFAWKE